MQEHADAGLHQPEGGHQFRGARKRAAGFNFQDPQDRRDESARVANADPEHNLDQEYSPVNRAIYTSHT